MVGRDLAGMMRRSSMPVTLQLTTVPPSSTFLKSAGPLLHFIETSLFAEESLLSDDELRALQELLQENPTAGRLVQGAGGVRKVRVPYGGRGRSYGARVVYYFRRDELTIYLLLAYDKTESDDLSKPGKEILRRLVARL
jgi:mRNA-degrading endonuclease RelE of RelBE toxin-antitoxin system